MFSPILAILKILQCLANKKILVKFKKIKLFAFCWNKKNFFFFLSKEQYSFCFLAVYHKFCVSFFLKVLIGGSRKKTYLYLVMAAAPWSNGVYWGEACGHVLYLKATEAVQEETHKVQPENPTRAESLQSEQRPGNSWEVFLNSEHCTKI